MHHKTPKRTKKLQRGVTQLMTCSINPQQAAWRTLLEGGILNIYQCKHSSLFESQEGSLDGPGTSAQVPWLSYPSEELNQHLPKTPVSASTSKAGQSSVPVTSVSRKETKQTIAARVTNSEQPQHRCNSWSWFFTDRYNHHFVHQVPKPSHNLKKATEVSELHRLSNFKHAVL